MNTNLELLPNLSKDYILTYITQEQIFERYLGFPVVYDRTFACPHWNDSTPSCGFKWTGNKLRMKDFGGHFWGDCFDFVAFVNNIDGNNGKGFIEVLNKIAKEFRLHKYANGNYPVENRNLSNQGLLYSKGETDSFKKLEITKRNWNTYDAEFWSKSYISKGTLEYYNVYPCEYVWKDGEIIYTYSKKDPAYCYYRGKDSKNRDLMKIYFPLRNRKKGYRFMMNYSGLEGLNRIKPAEVLVISKAYKDLMCLKCITYGKINFSMESVSLSSENHSITDEEYQNLWKDYSIIVSLMDFDFQGRNMAWKLKTKYNIHPLFLTDGTRGSKKDYGSKDFSDYAYSNGKENALLLVEEAYNYIKTKHLRTDEDSTPF